MNGISFDVLAEILADGAFRSIGGIGGAHDLADPGYGVVAFEDSCDDGSRSDVGEQAGEEGFVDMGSIVFAGKCFIHLEHAAGNEFQAFALDPVENSRCMTVKYCIGFD